jgi:anti-anti-sigma factor
VPNRSDVVWYLRIEQEHTGGVAVLTAAGRISSLTCPDLGAALAAAVHTGTQGVVVDLAAVDYISSAGLRALEHASAHLADSGRHFIVCGLGDAVTMAFSLAGLTGVVAVEPSRELAIQRAQQPKVP